jgi:prepilin-type N-terminal cleavage/methylation domain-containing protein
MTTTARSNRSRHGFTLIELVAVLTIAAILSALAATSLKQPFQAARLDVAVGRLVAIDRQMRDHARRFCRPAELSIRLETGEVSAAEEGGHEIAIPPLRLDGVVLDQIATAAKRTESGEVTILFTTCGRTITYAVRLRDKEKRPHWIVFAGATGQTTELDDEDRLEELLQMLSAQRIDAA